MPRTKRTEGVKWRRDACMNQIDIARVLNVSQIVVSRLMKQQREAGNVKESKRSSLSANDCH